MLPQDERVVIKMKDDNVCCYDVTYPYRDSSVVVRFTHVFGWWRPEKYNGWYDIFHRDGCEWFFTIASSIIHPDVCEYVFLNLQTGEYRHAPLFRTHRYMHHGFSTDGMFMVFSTLISGSSARETAVVDLRDWKKVRIIHSEDDNVESGYCDNTSVTFDARTASLTINRLVWCGITGDPDVCIIAGIENCADEYYRNFFGQPVKDLEDINCVQLNDATVYSIPSVKEIDAAPYSPPPEQYVNFSYLVGVSRPQSDHLTLLRTMLQEKQDARNASLKQKAEL